MDQISISGRQLAAARTLVGKTQAEVANAAGISIPTLKRMESSAASVAGIPNNIKAVITALENAGVIFIDQNGNGPGVRLRDRI
ncbi:MAG: XRE family transcriptional regulator [Oxalobacteraceae bacterium]|nr:MAG: XRE family transcriptional regulator [Oxalobacteraceae bacterium]